MILLVKQKIKFVSIQVWVVRRRVVLPKFQSVAAVLPSFHRTVAVVVANAVSGLLEG